MRLYNPNYKKHAKRDKIFSIIAGCWSALVALAAIGFLVFLIINQWAWYFYLADIVGGLILAFLLWWIFPSAEREYIDFEDFETQKKLIQEQFPDTKIIVRATPDIVRGHTLGCFAQRGLFGGIAVCDCGEVFDPKNITFDVERGSSKRTSAESGNLYYSQYITFTVHCKCKKCGKEKTESFGKEFDIGSTVYKHEMFSDKTTVLNTSEDIDYSKFIAEVYEQDLKRYVADKAEYEKFLAKKMDELKCTSDRDESRIAELRAKGWYERPKRKSNKGTGKKGE